MDQHILESFTPPLSREEFVRRYKEEPEDWYPYAQQMLDEIDSIGLSISKDNSSGIKASLESPFSLYMINKNLPKLGITFAELYDRINSYGLRSDEFKKEHSGTHILFAGCSVTFGAALPEEYIWPRLVYDELSASQEVSGYYNLGVNGGTHVDILNQVFSYIKNFGNPDILFINFPDTHRLVNSGMPEDKLWLVSSMYDALELYCKNAGVNLISFSHFEWHNNNPPINDNRIIIENDPMDDIKERNTFYKFSLPDLAYDMFKSEKDPLPKQLKDYRTRALDNDHPGISAHKFYAAHALASLRGNVKKTRQYKKVIPQDRSRVPKKLSRWIQERDFELVEEFHNNLEPLTEVMRKEIGLLDSNGIILQDSADHRSFYIERQELATQGKMLSDLYSISSKGFRSDEFKKQHDGLHILFAGCSVTFGQGLFLEDTWSKIVYNEIAKTNKVSGYYNLSMPGAGRLTITRLIEDYINKYSMPDLILINYPDSFRELDLSGDLPEYPGVSEMKQILDKISDRVVTMTWSSEHEYDPIPAHGEFTTEDIRYIRDSIVDPINMIKYSQKDMLKFVDSFEYNGTPDYLKWRAFDLAHPGVAQNKFFADLFLSNIKDFGV